MGHYVKYLYVDIDNSFDRIKNQSKTEDNYLEATIYIEPTIEGFDLIIDNFNPLVIITTMVKYSLKDNYNLKPLEKYLRSITKSKIYRIDELLLGEWQLLTSEEEWRTNKQSILDFFSWLQEQDHESWSVI